MTDNCKDLIKALALIADEENIYVTNKKSAFVRGAEVAEGFGDETASNYLKCMRILDGAPQRMSYVLLNKLSKSQRLQLTSQVIKALNGNPSEVAKLIVEDRQLKALALSALRAFIEDHTDFAIDNPPEDTCCIL